MGVKIRTLADGCRELQISSPEAVPEVSARYLEGSCNAVGVMLFQAGSALADVDFVRELPGLRSIRLHGDIHDCDAIFDVATLRRLDLVHCRPPAVVRFDSVPALESLGFVWGPAGGGSIESLDALRSLDLLGWSGTRLPLGRHSALRRLRLEARRTAVVRLADLAGIAGAVEELVVESATLTGDGLDFALSAVESLTLDGCRLPSLSFLAGASRLRQLTLANCGAIPSLADLAELPGLETFLITGTSHLVDDDLEVLYRMPALREVALERGRPHYSRKPAEIRADFPLGG